MKPDLTPLEREKFLFWRRVDTNDSSDGCFVWKGKLRPSGYGTYSPWGKNRSINAHRAGWILENGPIKPGLQVCHRCDNPACCRISHLFLGTQAENMDDKVRKGRHWRKLTPEIVADVRRQYLTTKTSYRKLGKQFGLSGAMIGYIVTGKVCEPSTHAPNSWPALRKRLATPDDYLLYP